MKDILFIGGPATLTGVDRIGDDLLSILSAEGLYDRKAVVVWPTKSFLSLPVDPDKLSGVANMDAVELMVMEEKGLIPPSGSVNGSAAAPPAGARNSPAKAWGASESPGSNCIPDPARSIS